MPDTIICPKCRYEIEVTEVLSAQLRSQLQKEFDAEIRRQEAAIAEREKAVALAKSKIDQAESEVEQARARYVTIQEETIHYQGLNDQILLQQQKIMNQDVGVRYIREGKQVWQEKVIPLETHPWAEVAEEHGRELMEQSIGKHGITPCLPSSTSTGATGLPRHKC